MVSNCFANSEHFEESDSKPIYTYTYRSIRNACFNLLKLSKYNLYTSSAFHIILLCAQILTLATWTTNRLFLIMTFGMLQDVIFFCS